MKTFAEWSSDYQDPSPVVNLAPDASYRDIVNEINRAAKHCFSYLGTHPEEDRLEFKVYGTEVRVWRTKINTVEKLHLGRKAPWERHFYETSPDLGVSIRNLIEYLVVHRGG